MVCEGLVDLFSSIASQKRRVGVYTPKKFVSRLKRENGKLQMCLDCLLVVCLLPVCLSVCLSVCCLSVCRLSVCRSIISNIETITG